LTLVATGLAAATVAGCSLLMGGAGFGPDLPSSSPIASFSEGRATIAIDGGEPIELNDVGAASGIDAMFGSNVTWSNADGWHLRVNGAGATFGGDIAPPEMSYLSLDRITDGQHWTTYDPTRCIVDIEVADETAIRGTATCKGLEWYDSLDAFSGTTQPKAVDAPKFDAEITFEATP
jgi:hypothetical protein